MITAPLCIEFAIPGAPVAWQRARRSGDRYYVSGEQQDARDAIRLAYLNEHRRSAPVGGKCSVEYRFVFQPNKKDLIRGQVVFPCPKGTRPDLDNLVKLVNDALNGLAWLDDAQVVEFYADKVFDHRPETRVKITWL